MAKQPTKANPIIFDRVKKAVYKFWTAKNGRWYWCREVNGEVTMSGNYAHRSSVRRTLKEIVAREKEIQSMN